MNNYVIGLTASSMKVASQLAGLHPYKKKILHKLYQPDFQRRLTFANWFLTRPPHFENSLIVTDESVFDLNGFSNRQNEIEWYPYGTGGNPTFSKELAMQPDRLMIWTGLLGI